jgi:folate-dependent phosphoribosylglycinamide formyltransferase PurN
VYHALRSRLHSSVRLHVVLEEPVSRALLLRRRARRLGAARALGQLAFSMLAVPLLRLQGRRRVAEILRQYGLHDRPIPEPLHRVRSANAPETLDLLRSLDPNVVVVNGTRILKPETLNVVTAPFINMHAGITPAYRGVHGGYWALAEGRADLVGTTVHRVDEGIDTGSVIDQAYFPVSPEDTFSTYPYLHIACGLPLLMAAVDAVLEAKPVPTVAPDAALPSVLRYHPTLLEYLRARVRLGVR